MSAIESLKGSYYALEDKWYSLIDGVSEKVPAVGGIVDALEDKNIPTFPLAIIVVILLILLLVFALTAQSASSLTLTITGDDSNPIAGATVVVLSGTDEKGNQTTDTDGKVTFYLQNGDYSIKIDKSGYNSLPKEVTVNGNSDLEYTLSLQDTTISKAVYLKTASGQLISGSGIVTYRCKGDATENTATYSNGTFNASLKKTCSEIEVLDLQNYNVISGTASFSGSGIVTVEQQVVVTGTVNVNLAIENTTVVPRGGLQVSLVPSDGTSPIVQYSSGTGLVSFTNVPIKSYYVLVTDSNGEYQTYQGNQSGDVKAVTKDTLSVFNVTLKKVPSSTIQVNLKDSSTGKPVSGAQVTLNLSSNSNDTRAQISGSTGQLSFKVNGDGTYTIIVDHPDYIVSTTSGVTAGEVKTISLTKVDSTNSNSLLVQVTDPKKNPIENARVTLKKIDPTEPVVDEKTTGATGGAEFYNLEAGISYMATVSKEGFGSVNTESVQIIPRAQKTLPVTFDIGEGTIQVKVMTAEKAVLSGVSVKAINAFTSQAEGTTQLTSSEGIANFTVRADKKVYFVIESTGYSKYFTTAFNPTANASIEKDVIMMNLSANLTSTIVGIYSGTNEVAASTGSSSSNSLSQGTYTVKAVVQVPKGIFSEAGLHLRTGKETANVTNLVEEDGLYLSRVESSGRITKGDTYSPPNGYAKDSSNLTTGNAKWANSVWKNPQEGTYEVEADITVTETNPNAELALFYRAWAKGSSTLRDPTSTTSAQNDLYSIAKKRVLTFGSSTACTSTFCKSYTLQTQSGSNSGKTVYVTSSTTGTKGTQYLLTANFTNYSGRAISGASLSVTGKGIDINAISVNGNEVTDKTINLGTLGIDAPVQVQVLFTSTTSGAEGVKFTVNSSTKTEFEDTVTLNVPANKTFNLSIIPLVIVPYINNSLFFEAKDGNNFIDGALIEIKSSGILLGNVTTGSDGLATYELAAPSLGKTISIKASKEGYDDVEVDKTVDEALLTITPPTIEETLKIGDVTGMTTSVILQNNTAQPLKIVGVQINGDMKAYLEAKFTSTIEGTVVDTGKDRNYDLSLKLNSNASRLDAPKDVTGTIVFETTITGTNQTYVTELPISIHLSMPGFMDSAKCLTVTPTTLEFVTSDASQSKTITLTNQCTAEQTKIALRNLQAKLSEASKFGTITLSGQGFNSTSLSDQYVKIADFMDKDTESTLSINFTPSTVAASGTQAISISIIGKNITDDLTEEKTESTVKANITMSNLSKCIEIIQPQGGILLDIAPWNLGYGRIMQSDLSAYAQNYGGFSNRSSPYGMGNTYLAGMGMQGYGMSGYGMGYQNSFNPMMGSYGGMGGQGNVSVGQNGATQTASYEQSSFMINNNCADSVDITLNPDARINVSQDKFTIEKDSSTTVTVNPGYVLGKYKVTVNAKPTSSEETKKKISDVSVVVRRLGDTDTDCISTNVTTLNLNSVISRPQKYTVYNYCYDTGVQLNRSNLASIECSAPDQTTAAIQGYNPYASTLQTTGLGAYSPYGGMTTSNIINQGLMQQSGCPTNACSLISGTSVWFRSLQEGGPKGTMEKVDFQVYPNTAYIPQSKLFNSRSGTYGPFQSIGDIRNWMTQSDSRINVYGKLNISYQNQYGVGQCQEFPITLEDIWRWTEILDSAFNWGDPQAKPIDCQNKTSLNLVQYWKNRGQTNGEVPEDRFTNGTTYIYIADPAALKIGPAQTQHGGITTANDYSYYRSTESANKSDGETAAKNCGLLDSIDILTKIPQEKLFGAVMTIEPTPNLGENASGSLLQNTRGHNLMVEINRTQMTANCVHLTMPISAKVTRKVNFESQELTWILDVIFTKQGYTLKGTPNECQQAGTGTVTPTPPTQIVSQCGDNNFIKYGFDKIAKTTLPSMAKSDTVDCTTSFCNGDMLQAFTLNKFSDIRDAISAAKNSGKISTDASITSAKLSELYKEALNKDPINVCGTGQLNFFQKENKNLITEAYPLTMPSPLTTYRNKTIVERGASALGDMYATIQSINAKDYNSVLVEIDKNDLFKDYFTKTLAMTQVNGDKYYMSLKAYEQLNNLVNSKSGTDGVDCAANAKNCTITSWCGQATTDLNVDAFAWMSTHAKLVKGIYYASDMNKLDIERVYVANPILNGIHKLAIFNTTLADAKVNDVSGDLLLTAIPDLSKRPVDALFSTNTDKLKELTLKFNSTTAEVGKYSVELDYDYASAGKEMQVTLGSKTQVPNAPNANQNPLLTAGFNVVAPETATILSKAANGIILESNNNTVLFYKTIPVKLNVSLNQGETAFAYKLALDNYTAPNNLINWYIGGALKGSGANMGNSTFAFPFANITQIQGIYYYPPLGQLAILEGKTGGRVSANALVLSPERAEANINTARQGPTALQLQINPDSVTLDNVLAAVKAQTACPAPNTVVWNEAVLIKQ